MTRKMKTTAELKKRKGLSRFRQNASWWSPKIFGWNTVRSNEINYTVGEVRVSLALAKVDSISENDNIV